MSLERTRLRNLNVTNNFWFLIWIQQPSSSITQFPHLNSHGGWACWWKSNYWKVLLRFMLSYVHAMLTCTSRSTVSLINWPGYWPCRWKSQLLKSRSSDCVIWCTCIRKRPYVYTQFLKNQFRSLNWYPPTEELLLRLCCLVHEYEKQMAILTCIPSSSENPGVPSLTDLVIRHAGGGIPTTEELLLRSCHPVHTYPKMATLTCIPNFSH